ncbi:hypothetical protein N9889_00010 [bacterium]|nr:hypothetical protein [bacterium]MDB4505114.1 hypothetical protein [Akkermansiaceae bacterium]
MKTFFRRLLWFVVILTVLFFGGWGFENWRGGSEWRKAQERAARMGVSLDLADYAAEEIPEGESLMEDPTFLAEWNGEIEPVLDRITSMKLEGVKTRGIRSGSVWKGEAMGYRQYFEEEMSGAEAVRKLDEIYRPVAARLEKLGKVVLEKPPQGQGARSDIFLRSEAILRLLKTGNAFQEFARLSLRKGDSKKAVWACEAIVQFGDHFAESALIDLLVSYLVKRDSEKAIWDGIWLRKWTGQDLDRLAALIPTDPDYDSLEKALRYESAMASWFVDQAEELDRKILDDAGKKYGINDPPSLGDRVSYWTTYQGPSGWQDWRKATMLNVWLDLLKQRSAWETSGKESPEFSGFETSRFHPLVWVRNMQGHEGGLIAKVQKQATRSRLARIAIELEKYRLQERDYPESLDVINLSFSIQDLTDPEGRDLRYEKTDNGYFHLWSEFGKERKGQSNLEWRFPETDG